MPKAVRVMMACWITSAKVFDGMRVLECQVQILTEPDGIGFATEL